MFRRFLRGGAIWAGEAIPDGGLDDGTPVPGLNSSSSPSGDVPRLASGPGTSVPEELRSLCRHRVPGEHDLRTGGRFEGSHGAFRARLRGRAQQEGQGGLEAFWRARPGLLAAGLFVQHQLGQVVFEKQITRLRTANWRGGVGTGQRRGRAIMSPGLSVPTSGRDAGVVCSSRRPNVSGESRTSWSSQPVDRVRATALVDQLGGWDVGGREARRPNHGREAYRPNPRSGREPTRRGAVDRGVSQPRGVGPSEAREPGARPGGPRAPMAGGPRPPVGLGPPGPQVGTPRRAPPSSSTLEGSGPSRLLGP